MERTKYDVFISYSRNDYVDEHKNVIPGNEVSEIKEALTKAGVSYWIDEEGIGYGEGWAGRITASIKSSKMLLFLASEMSNKSVFTKKEIAIANDCKKPIIPLLLDNSNFDEDTEFYLAGIQYIAYFKDPHKGIVDLVEAIREKLFFFRA